MNRPRLSWNMEEDGVIAILATDDAGRMFPLMDLFRQPMIARGGMSKDAARAFQIFAAERVCAAWNNDKAASQIAIDHKIDPGLSDTGVLTDWGQGHNAACEQIAHEIFRRFKL